MNILQRIKDICLTPKQTWPVIAGESATVQSLFVPYMLILAGFSALCSFVGMSIIGMGGFGMSFKLPVGAGLTMMLSSFVLTLLMTFVLGLVINALAPTFGGQKDQISAMKLAVYAMTPSAIGAVFNLVPMLGILGLLCALYGLYLLYIGLPVLMKNPEDKSLIYTLAVLVAGVVCGIVIGMINAMIMPKPDFGNMLGGSDGAAITTPFGEIKVNPADPKVGAKTGSSDGDAVMNIQTPDGQQVKIEAGVNEKDGQMTIQTGEGSITIDMKKMEEMAKKLEALQQKNNQ